MWTFPALAKTPGQTYCFRGICHRVLTVEETKRMVGRTETVVASFYDDPKVDGANPNIMTSSGERFDPRGFHAEVLRDGSVPLAVLEAKIDRWIAAQQAP